MTTDLSHIAEPSDMDSLPDVDAREDTTRQTWGVDLTDVIIFGLLFALTVFVLAQSALDRREPAPFRASVVSLSALADGAQSRFVAAGVSEHEARLMAVYAVSFAETRLEAAQDSGELGAVMDRDAFHVTTGLVDLTDTLLEICLEDVQTLLASDTRLSALTREPASKAATRSAPTPALPPIASLRSGS